MNRFEDLQLPYRPRRTWGGFVMKATIIGVIGGTLIATIASSCSLHRPWNELAKQQPGIIMNFKPVVVEPMPNVVPAIDLDASQTFSI